jgi:hypothetical protein
VANQTKEETNSERRNEVEEKDKVRREQRHRWRYDVDTNSSSRLTMASIPLLAAINPAVSPSTFLTGLGFRV